MCSSTIPDTDLARNLAENKPGSTATVKSAKYKDADHLFVNNVRFLSMTAVICVHAIGARQLVLPSATYPNWLLYLQQPFKFGTIAFFLGSGFLFGERIDHTSSLVYLTRRLQTVFVPWLLWYLMFCLLMIVPNIAHGRVSLDAGSLIPFVRTRSLTVLFETSFWFVPNLLLAMTVLLAFRRAIDRSYLGLVLILISLLYGVNVYMHWFPARHTKAIFGFISYLWIGAWSARHFELLRSWLDRISTRALAALTVSACLLCLLEERLLIGLGSSDPLNTLRPTNQIYSVLVFLLILRLRRQMWPRFVNVRAHTFTLYLTHTAVQYLLCAALRQLPVTRVLSFGLSGMGTLALITSLSAVTWISCLAIGKLFGGRPGVGWIVGSAASRKRESAAPVNSMKITDNSLAKA